VVFTCRKQACHWICGRGQYDWFGPARNCWLCSWRGLRECAGYSCWCQVGDAGHYSMVGMQTTVNLGGLSLCWGLLGSSIWVWCRGQYLQEDVLWCVVMLGFLAWLLLHCVVGRVEKLQAWGLGFE